MDIVDSNYGLEFIEKVRPRTFKWNRRELAEGDKNHSMNGKRESTSSYRNFKKMEEDDNQLLDLVYNNPERLEIKPVGLIPTQ